MKDARLGRKLRDEIVVTVSADQDIDRELPSQAPRVAEGQVRRSTACQFAADEEDGLAP
jgi:hypothetical protein